MALLIEGICRRSYQKVLVASGKFDVIMAEHNARQLEFKAARTARLQAAGYIAGRKRNYAAATAVCAAKRVALSIANCAGMVTSS